MKFETSFKPILVSLFFTVLSGEIALAGVNRCENILKTFSCLTDDGHTAALEIVKIGDGFNILAKSKRTILINRNDLRPSLNVRIAVGQDDVRNEFIDFNQIGLEVIPVDGKDKLEIDLAAGRTIVHFEDAINSMQLNCAINPLELILFLEITPRTHLNLPRVNAVAFDIDDTLMFTSPTFARGFATGGSPKPDDVLFWIHTNGCDQGCVESTITLSDGTTKILPANEPSTPKAKALELIRHHQSLGHEVYAITARPDINGEPLRDYIESEMGIERNKVFFEPDLEQPGNPAGKTDRIESLNLDVFYGDSDSDITDTLKAFVDRSGSRSKMVYPVRFFRSPKSSNRKAGMLNKYHPGYFGEPILSGSY